MTPPEDVPPAASGGDHRAGFVAIVGRPNVGKSTLLNRILGVKLAIVTPKPQTTRHRILGIKSNPGAQLLFVDTPGLHRSPTLLNERMVEVARRSLADADVVLWVVDAIAGLTPADQEIVAELGAERHELVVALNKIDRVDRGRLLSLAGQLGDLLPQRHVVPVSAETGENIDELVATVEKMLPVSPPLYPEDAQTDLPERFFAAEIVREQVFLATREEVPYQSAVRLDEFTEREGRGLLFIRATILVSRTSQRAILLGERGERVKAIGQRARGELERFFGTRVFLELFVKVDPRWFENPRTLGELGL
jgi:GTP-binding protein Era